MLMKGDARVKLTEEGANSFPLDLIRNQQIVVTQRI